MRRQLTASAVFALAILTTAAAGQPPGGAPSQPPVKMPDKKADKPVDPTDAVIAAALANDPDVKMAKAKIQLAEAELAKARQAVTLKVVMLKAKIEQAKSEVRAAEDRLAHVTRLFQAATVQQTEVLAAREKLESAKAALALVEAEWKLLTGGTAVTAGTAGTDHDDAVRRMLYAVTIQQAHAALHDDRTSDFARIAAILAQERPAVKGPIPDRIRAALDKPVKLGAKGEKIAFEKALEIFKKEAGLDVPVRGEDAYGSIVSQGEELPVGAWFQVYQDNFPAVLYVREYGLLLAPKQAAPPDAIGVVEFWKQKPPVPKETKPESPKK